MADEDENILDDELLDEEDEENEDDLDENGEKKKSTKNEEEVDEGQETEDKIMRRIFQGDFENLPSLPSKIVRIFTSSTFTG